MTTVYIIVEGQTEEEFVNNSLSHYFKGLGIAEVKPILAETSPGFFGGDLSFSRYKLNVELLLKSDPQCMVTSLIDFYELRSDFPGFASSMIITDKMARVEFLEQQISSVIINERFVPYIQLHEFEGLLFSDIRGFDYLRRFKPGTREEIVEIIAAHPNPELINDGVDTAPSKRLKLLISRYNKKLYGPMIALENGMVPVLAKCTRFAAWVDKIVKLYQSV